MAGKSNYFLPETSPNAFMYICTFCAFLHIFRLISAHFHFSKCNKNLSQKSQIQYVWWKQIPGIGLFMNAVWQLSEKAKAVIKSKREKRLFTEKKVIHRATRRRINQSWRGLSTDSKGTIFEQSFKWQGKIYWDVQLVALQSVKSKIPSLVPILGSVRLDWGI